MLLIFKQISFYYIELTLFRIIWCKFTTNAEHEHHYNEEYFHTTLPHSTKKPSLFTKKRLHIYQLLKTFKLEGKT